jgi:colanic acid biosynthesis protein WcaH
MIDKEDFLKIIDLTPLVSIDLIIKNNKDEYLLGKRTNRPARGYWFVPGGRIRKNEKTEDAIKRISAAELGVEITLSDAQLYGAYDHIYDDNCFSEKSINTHYVVLAYTATIGDTFDIKMDAQHSMMKWWTEEQIIDSPEVHENTRAYFLARQ